MANIETLDKLAALRKELIALDKRFGFSINVKKPAQKAAKYLKIAKTLQYLELAKIDFLTGNNGVHIRIFDTEGRLWCNLWPTVSKLHEIEHDGTLLETIGFKEIFEVL